MTLHLPHPRLFAGSSSGVALVVTLMMMSILVMMVVGLAGVMRNEQAAARNLTYQVLAEQVAEVGARQGMTAVLTSTPAAGQMTATGPGWILAGNTTRYLFSPAPSAQEIKNIERIGTNSLILGLPAGTLGGIYAGWSNLVLPGQPADRPIARYAWWVDDEGTKLNLNAVGINNTEGFLPLLTNFPVSADWVFVDPATGATNATNFAQAQALRSRVQWLPTPESLKGSNFLNFTNPQVSGGTNNLMREDEYHRIKGHVTTWSSNADLTPWGAPKVNLADPATTAAQIKAMLTTNVWTNVSGANRTLARKYGGGFLTAGAAGNSGDILMDQIAQNICTAAGFAPTVNLNTNNPGNTDPNRQRFNLPRNAVGLTEGPFLNEVAVSVSSRDQLSTPPEIDVSFFFQIEIFNPWPKALPAGYTVELQPRKLRFHIGYNVNPPSIVPVLNPPHGGAWPDSAGADPNTGLTGAFGCWAGPMMDDGVPWPALPSPGGLVLGPATVPGIPAQSWAVVSLSQTYQCFFPPASGVNAMQVDQAYVMIDKIILRDATGTIVDWLSLDDFAQGANYGSSNTKRNVSPAQSDYGLLIFSPTYPAGFKGTNFVSRPVDAVPAPVPPASFIAASSIGLAKNDPRVRFPATVWGGDNGEFKVNGFPATLQAWKRAPNPTLGADNASGAGVFDATSTNGVVTGISYLNPDPAPGVTATLNHPHFSGGYAISPPPSGAGFRSVAQLGSIHTGLPWRTLRLQPTSAAELAQGPPDWVLLDAFTATNPSVALPRVNLNGLITSLQSPSSPNPGVPVNSANLTQTRPWPLLGTLGGLRSNLTSTNTNAYISNGVVVALRTNTNAIFDTNRLRNLSQSLGTVLGNPNVTGPGWATISGWPGRRAALSNNFPPNGLAFTGELLELAGLAEDPAATLGEDVLEGRLRGFLDMVTTRSDTFSVWSIGQGLVVVTNNAGTPIRTNVMGEVRKQTVFQREPLISAGAVTGYRIRTLYTRNHLVE